MNINKKRSYDPTKINPELISKKSRIRFQRVFSLAAKDPNEPCPECGTVLNDWMNKKIIDIPRSLRHNLFICSHCVQYMAGEPLGVKKAKEAKEAKQAKETKVSKPRGWHFLKCYVDPEGNYFEFGEEKPELKGTVEPTFTAKPKEPKPKAEKLNKKKKLRLSHAAAAILYDLKKVDPTKYNKKDKKIFDNYLSQITLMASATKFPKNFQEILDQYDKQIKKL